jgi:hypothetical protein
MPPVGFEPTVSAGERLQTYALKPLVLTKSRVKIERKKVNGF